MKRITMIEHCVTEKEADKFAKENNGVVTSSIIGYGYDVTCYEGDL